MSLRSENEKIRNDVNSERQINERLRNDLNSEKKLNERIMRFQEDMDQLNQLNEHNLYRQKGKARIGYKEEEESSKKGAQKYQKPTCIHYGKIGHTSKKCWSNGKEKFNGKCYNCS